MAYNIVMKDKRIIIKITNYKPKVKSGIPKHFIQKIYHLKCLNCGRVFKITPKRFNQGVGKFCNKKCIRYDGKFNPRWKGGVT